MSLARNDVRTSQGEGNRARWSFGSGVAQHAF